MLEKIVTWILAIYCVIFQLPKLYRWLRFKRYTDDSFYDRQVGPNKPHDYL
jgi:hypothetical protein